MNAEYKYIEQLLDKYWKAETSTEEEAQLRDFFARDSVPTQFKEVAPLFRYFGDQKQQTMGEGQMKDENFRPTKPKPKSVKLPQAIQDMLKIAASIALFVALVFVFRGFLPEKTPQAAVQATPQDTYTDPREAYEQTKKALMMISTGMSSGTAQMVKLEKFHEAKEIVQEKEQ